MSLQTNELDAIFEVSRRYQDRLIHPESLPPPPLYDTSEDVIKDCMEPSDRDYTTTTNARVSHLLHLYSCLIRLLRATAFGA